MVVTLVSGPPCAGKTRYVAEHAGPDDLVLDQDSMGRAAFDRALLHVHVSGAHRVWVIRCLAGPARRDGFAAELGVVERVHLHPPTPVLLERAQARPDPARHVAAVRSWLAQEAGRAPLPGTADPSPSVKGWWA